MTTRGESSNEVRWDSSETGQFDLQIGAASFVREHFPVLLRGRDPKVHGHSQLLSQEVNNRCIAANNCHPCRKLKAVIEACKDPVPHVLCRLRLEKLVTRLDWQSKKTTTTIPIRCGCRERWTHGSLDGIVDTHDLNEGGNVLGKQTVDRKQHTVVSLEISARGGK